MPHRNEAATEVSGGTTENLQMQNQQARLRKSTNLYLLCLLDLCDHPWPEEGLNLLLLVQPALQLHLFLCLELQNLA